MLWVLTFAPVVDLEHDLSSVIRKLQRSFGEDPEKVLEFTLLCESACHKKNTITTRKYFPVHGFAVNDTHNRLVDTTATYNIQELELYKELPSSDHSIIVTAYIVKRNLDQSELPAILSKTIIHNILRKDFGYQGIVITNQYTPVAVLYNANIATV